MTQPSQEPTGQDEDHLIDPAQLRVHRDDRGRVLAQVGDMTHVIGSVLSAFPLTRPGRMVLLRDENGEEIGVIHRLGELDADSRTILQQEREKSYFLPRIQNILSVREELNVVTFEVATDRGPRTFQVRSARQSIRRLGRGRLVIRDVDGSRYEIRNWLDLPGPAQILLEPYI